MSINLVPLNKPRVNSTLRKMVDLILEEADKYADRTFDVTVLQVKLGLSYGTITRYLNVIRRDYFLYIERDSNYRFGDRRFVGEWPKFDLTSKQPVPEQRWVDQSNRMKTAVLDKYVVRETFLDPPARGTSLGRVYWFLIENRTSGTGVVHIGKLVEEMGSKKVHRIIGVLRLKYGLEVTGAGQQYCFHVRKRRRDIYERLKEETAYAKTGKKPVY